MKQLLLASALSFLTVTSANALTDDQVCLIVAETAYQAQHHQRAGTSYEEVLDIVNQNVTEETLPLVEMIVTVTEGVYNDYSRDQIEIEVAIDVYNRCIRL